MDSSGGIAGLATKLDYLFTTVPKPGGGKYTNESVAKALTERGISVTTTHISHLHAGRRNNPSAVLLEGIAQLFGVPLSYFFDSDLETQVNAELRKLAQLRDKRVTELLARTDNVSDNGMKALLALLDQIRTLEGLDEPSQD